MPRLLGRKPSKLYNKGKFQSSQSEAISKDMKSADSTKKRLNMDVVGQKGQDRFAEKRRKSHVCFGDGVEEAEAVDAEAGAANGGKFLLQRWQRFAFQSLLQRWQQMLRQRLWQLMWWSQMSWHL